VTSKGIDRFVLCVDRMAFGGKGKTLHRHIKCKIGLDLDVTLNLCESHRHDLYHMRRKFVVLKQLCFNLAIVKVDKLDHLDKSLSELDQVTVILGLKGKIMTTDELDCCNTNKI
jgi:hypothetical protein